MSTASVGSADMDQGASIDNLTDAKIVIHPEAGASNPLFIGAAEDRDLRIMPMREAI